MNAQLKRIFVPLSLILAVFYSCSIEKSGGSEAKDILEAYVSERLPIYAKVRLTTDIQRLTANERQVLPILIQAAQQMGWTFWAQAYPQKDSLLATIKDTKTREFLLTNYGPWDRLNGNKAFVKGVGRKPPGSGFYPPDISKAELESSDIKDKKGLYSMVRRDSTGKQPTIFLLGTGLRMPPICYSGPRIF